MKTFPQSTEFLIGKARSPNSVLAAYAMQCLPDPNVLPADVLVRTEMIALRDWFHEQTIPLGDWARKLIDEENRASKWLAEETSDSEEIDQSGR